MRSPDLTNIDKNIREQKHSLDFSWEVMNAILSKDNPTELDLLDLLFSAYLILNQIKDVCDFLSQCGVMIEAGAMKTYPQRKIHPADVGNALYYFQSENKLLRDMAHKKLLTKKPKYVYYDGDGLSPQENYKQPQYFKLVYIKQSHSPE